MNSTSKPVYCTLPGVLGASFAMMFTATGAAYGTSKSGTSVAAVGIVRPQFVMRSVIPVIMSGIISIYGLILSILITTKLSTKHYTLMRGFKDLGAGLSVGLTGLMSGIAIGVIGENFLRAITHEPRLFVGMILILIFAEVLGIYGLVLSIILFL